jgi:predicted transcriptional regulator YheO
MKKTEIRNAIIASYSVLVDYLADLFGTSCEVVLHVIEDGVSSIRKIRNGHISGREAGIITDEIGTRIPKQNQNIDYIINNYENSPTGLEIKTNTFFINSPDGNLIGMLCVNIDLSLPLLAKNYLEDFIGKLSTSSHSKPISSDRSNSKVTSGFGEKDMFKSLSKDIIRDVIKKHGIPVKRMTPEERIVILGDLKAQGVFRIKYAVKEVARNLNISEPSVYRYLRELK